ncbi:MAG: hypothetical protein LRS48_06430 [Desulfurococcales archaeon]|nr:hypothetical protein [Desulfurococcales archaeon]
MPLTTFEEEIYLRALTGRMVGKAIADLNINKLAVVAPKNIICSSIATATEAAFIDYSGGVTYHFMVELGKNEEEIAKRLKDFNAQVVLLQFGGESPIDQVKASFVKLLKAMAKENVPGAIVFHVRIFAAGGVKEAIADEEIKKYLEGKDLFVYTVGFDEGKVYVNKVAIEGGELKLQKLTEYHVTLEHADLLNRSLKDRKVTFQ